MWSMRTSASAPAMRIVRNRASVPAVCSVHTPAPTQTVRRRAFGSADRCGHSPAADSVPCSRSGRAGPTGPARSARVRVPAAPAGFDRASTPAVRAGRSSISTRSERSRRAEPGASHGGSWASACTRRSRGSGTDALFESSAGSGVDASRARPSHGGRPAIRARHISATGPARCPHGGFSAEITLSARSGAHAVCPPRISAALADECFPEPAPRVCSADVQEVPGTGGWCAARWQGAAITRRSSPSNVLRATRGPEADRPSGTPVRSILRGFVTHRACRLSARHCILNGIDAPSPDGRNRPTTRGVEV